MSDEIQDEIDLDEDLFDFDEVARTQASERAADEDEDQEVFGSWESEREDLLVEEPDPASAAPARARSTPATPAAPAYERTEPEEPELSASAPVRVTPKRAPAPARSAPARSSAAQARTRTPERTSTEEVPAQAPARRLRLSRGVVAITLSVTLLNGLLAVVLLRGNARMRDEVRAVDHEVASAGTHDATQTHATEDAPYLADPGAVFDAEAHPAFVEARDEIARGEYAAARQRIYALLAIIDRLEDPRRGAVEAEAQFVLAQTLHLEALERMGSAR